MSDAQRRATDLAQHYFRLIALRAGVGNGLELFALVAFIFAVCIFVAGWRTRCAVLIPGGNSNAVCETLACRGRRRRGARLTWASTAGLAVLAAATFYVSFRAQFTFMYAVKRQDLPALIEALIADVAMVVCSLLALGMACAGQSAKVARLLVVVFAGLSAGMNYLAADVSSFRSVAVYVMPPVVFAVCTDQTVAVIRRHGLGIAEDSAWTALGRLVLAVVRLAGIIVLYSLRFILAPAETAKGLRRTVLNAAPLPGAGQDHPAPEVIPGTAPVPEAAPGTSSRGDPAPGPGGRPRHPGALPGDPGEAAGTGDPGAGGRVLCRRPRQRTRPIETPD